jgi:hypothetical protein
MRILSSKLTLVKTPLIRIKGLDIQLKVLLNYLLLLALLQDVYWHDQRVDVFYQVQECRSNK